MKFLKFNELYEGNLKNSKVNEVNLFQNFTRFNMWFRVNHIIVCHREIIKLCGKLQKLGGKLQNRVRKLKTLGGKLQICGKL